MWTHSVDRSGKKIIKSKTHGDTVSAGFVFLNKSAEVCFGGADPHFCYNTF